MIHVEVVTPEATGFQGEAQSVSLPTPDGEITVLPHHIPLISTVVPGTATIRLNGEETLLAVTRGVIEVDGQSVRVLVQSADRTEALEEAAIEEARKRAEQLQHERRDDAEGFAEATALLERELAKLGALRRHRSRRAFTTDPLNR